MLVVSVVLSRLPGQVHETTRLVLNTGKLKHCIRKETIHGHDTEERKQLRGHKMNILT